jgi:hypothetical protein
MDEKERKGCFGFVWLGGWNSFERRVLNTLLLLVLLAVLGMMFFPYIFYAVITVLDWCGFLHEL